MARLVPGPARGEKLQQNPVIYSLVLTCRACGVEPYAWLRHVLTELPSRPPNADLEDLMPFNFAERASQQNTC